MTLESLAEFQNFQELIADKKFAVDDRTAIFSNLTFEFNFPHNQFLNLIIQPTFPLCNCIRFIGCSFSKGYYNQPNGFSWSINDQRDPNKFSFEYINCKLEKIVTLEGVVSEREWLFKQCTLEQLIFGGTFINKILLNECYLENIHCGAFYNEKEIIFLRCRIGKNAGNTIKIIKSQGKISFNNAKFYAAPEFYDIGYLMVFIGCSFTDFSQTAVTKYRQIKSEMHQHHNEQDADMFSSLELEARKNSELNWREHFFENIVSTFYKGFSDYGRSLGKPLYWMLALFLTFTNLFLWNESLFYRFDAESPLWVHLTDGSVRLETKVGLIKSGINILGPIGWLYETSAIQYKNFCALVAGFVQKLLATIMWFLWILQIRRRFKLS